ncbi:MAG: gspF [Acidimicrobiales bacterium]|nr:gspF [Acidimicrobiales bacterium]
MRADAAVVTLLPVAWAGSLVALSTRWHASAPRPLPEARDRAASAAPRRRPGPASRLGLALARLCGRTVAPVSAPWLGVGAVVVAAALVADPILAPVVAAAVALGASLARRAEQRREVAAVIVTLPEVVDLFALAAQAGQPVSSSLGTVAARASGPIALALRDAERRRGLGLPVAEALEVVAERAGDPIRPLVAALTASDRYGTPLVPALERLAAEARLSRRRRAEEAARRLPVTLLFPLVCCTLPAFALLTVVPLVASALRALRF